MGSEIEKLRALLASATPGPWGHTAHEVEGDSPCGGENCPFEDDHGEGETHGFIIASCDVDYETDRENDAALIVAAVNHLGRLLDVCEAAEALRLAYNGDDAELEMFAKNRLWACLSRLGGA